MTREEAIANLNMISVAFVEPVTKEQRKLIDDTFDMAIKALGQEPKTRWNNHQIACMLADLFGDACACNYNGIDEWLGELCDFKDTCCPNPVGVACWEQFLKYSQSRYTECGYEVRDKNALKERKTDVLDKIRAEIEKPLHDERCFDTADAKAQYIALNWCIEIIDKYRAGSEDLGDYPDTIQNQFDNMTGSMNL